ncbi:hypothetical protein ScPMuIL_001579 [Solemya velum]
MVKRKFEKETKDKQNPNCCDETVHTVASCDVPEIRQSLLQWYDENKRDLPWRHKANHPDRNERAYAIWVSEVMLQQTQVATVISYYNKWMKKWTTLQDLAKADLEEVNEIWSGLGYYSRGRRLHEGAKKVVNELDGEMPTTAEQLMKQLPGVGRYTAAAIASIALDEPTGLVDGNVIRVFCRLCMIGADSNSQVVIDKLWSLANTLVDPQRPGDWNQSVMELGATVCTPKTPACSTCPVKAYCKAHTQVNQEKMTVTLKLTQSEKSSSTIPDIECLTDNCKLCIPEQETWDSSLGRPEKGLLAGLWEFPSSILTPDEHKEHVPPKKAFNTARYTKFGLKFKRPPEWKHAGEVQHIFSHIHQTYKIWATRVHEVVDLQETCAEEGQDVRWVTKEKFFSSAVSTAMKKVFKAYEASVSFATQKHHRQNTTDQTGKYRRVNNHPRMDNTAVVSSGNEHVHVVSEETAKASPITEFPRRGTSTVSETATSDMSCVRDLQGARHIGRISINYYEFVA